MTRAALEHDRNRASTIAIYAIVDLGFHALLPGGGPDQRAVILVRQAQTRPEFQWGTGGPGPRVAEELMNIELVLRRYGLTASSCGAMRFVVDRRGEPAISRDGRVLELPAHRLAEVCERVGLPGTTMVVDGVNVQVSSEILDAEPRPRIFDFGRYRLCAAFENGLYAAWDRDCETMRGQFVLPGEDRYAQPDPRLSMASALDDPSWAALQDAIGSQAAPDRAILSARFDRFITRAVSPLPGPEQVASAHLHLSSPHA
jgi:hypothetical protein